MTTPNIPQKRCTHCGIEKPATYEYFANSKPARDGLQSWCRSCSNEQKRQAYKARPDKMRQQALRWYYDHREIVLEHHQQRRAAISEYMRQWQQANPEKIKAANHNYRARKLNIGGSHTVEDVQLQIRAQTDSKGRLICWWCDRPIKGKYHIDHRIPLNKGGSNDARNICITHTKCNQSKHDKLPHEYNGRLL